MRGFTFLLAVSLPLAHTSPVALNQQQVLQASSWKDEAITSAAPAPKKLHGRFLHITDLHADPFYKLHASTEEENACHRGTGPAGTYGAETSDCDSPYALMNATFKWIEDNLRDTIDFVVWTGDSARHDTDEGIPRSRGQVLGINEYIAGKFVEVFGTDEGNDQDLIIPIVPNFGNNDILPHNIMIPGPNNWLKSYSSVWSMFIPEEQRHGFERGGWFYVEVIPQKLAVFSLNTLYFFGSNSAVDGCALRSEPGFEHMEWLRIQLGFMRERGIKVILMGHVPPARTDTKQLWDETCWQKYTLWLQQYRDVVVGGLFGHMNVDHFFLQDTKDIDLLSLGDGARVSTRTPLDDEFTTESLADYLEELRDHWSKLPKVPAATNEFDDIDISARKKKEKKKKGKKDKDLKKIGGPWGERYQMSSISPSIVPNFFPTIRVIEYNITGLENAVTWFDRSSVSDISTVKSVESAEFVKSAESAESAESESDRILESLEALLGNYQDQIEISEHGDESIDKKKKHKKKPKNPDLIIPPPPTKGSPPGPAYSPQTLTLLGYTQYFANLTHINNDYVHDPEGNKPDDANGAGWHEGKHKNKPPKEGKPHPKKFKFEVEYSTFNDSKFKLKDMTVKSYLKLAHEIGRYVEKDTIIDKFSHCSEKLEDELGEPVPWSLTTFLDRLVATVEYYKALVLEGVADGADNHVDSAGKKHKKKKKHHKKKNNKTWLAFVKRAFVGTMSDEQVERFQKAREKIAAERKQG